jgi:predicted TPR repeat methyltransferase
MPWSTVRAARLDEAEAAARDLLVRFPNVHDGWDRLGIVHEARGDNRLAADGYRKVIDFIRQRPDRPSCENIIFMGARKNRPISRGSVPAVI